jgi:hypothetical protein
MLACYLQNGGGAPGLVAGQQANRSQSINDN